jgi:hypothetical protein
MTPDKTLLLDSLIVLCLLVGFGALGASLCSSEGEALATVEASPLELCADDVKSLHPRHQAILVHGSARREAVSYELALWYCRKVTPKGADHAMSQLRPLTSEEVAAW